jgi:hypothetical protein
MSNSIKILVTLLIAAASYSAPAQEGALHADFRGEGNRLTESCEITSAASVFSCAEELFTDHPLHVAAGSLPPQNGFGLGAAFVGGKNTTNWRTTWDIDAVGSTNASYRAGGYLTMVHTPPVQIKILQPVTSGTGGSEQHKSSPSFVHPYTVVHLYAQSISLNELFYFGLGNDSALSGQTVFGMQETIAGVSAIKPVFEWPAIRALNLSLEGEMNGRFVSLRGNHSASVPSIEMLYSDATAPGLASQPATAQFGESVRIDPKLWDRLELNYLGTFQQYAASSDSHNSFLRWTVDLNHTFSIYGHTQSAAAANSQHGPDECANLSDRCPSVSYSRNLSGSIEVRLLLSESVTSSANSVPFYFQPTLGGSDIDGESMLASYQDYRFRAPNLLLLNGSFEHSIWGPLGFAFSTDQGKVEEERGDIDFDHLKHSFAAGITLRAGGFPLVNVMFAWGGREGHHDILSMNPSLLGGSARPSLF